jgi:hypothetical protein
VIPVDDTIELGEATLAVLGMTNVLRGDIPRIGVGVQKEILGIGKKIDALADDFVWDRLPKRLSMPRPFTYRKLLETFTRPIPQATITTIVEQFPRDAMDIALSFQSSLQNAYKHLSDMTPVADYDTYLGPKRIMPTSDKTFEFFNQYWVVDNPLIAFNLMQQGALIPEQATTLKEFFPSLYNHMTAALLNSLISRNTKEPSFLNLPPRADRGLATFKLQRIVPYGTSSHVIPPKNAPSASSAPPKVNAGLQTPGQKADSL